MRFKVAHLLLVISLLGTVFPAKAIVPFDIEPMIGPAISPNVKCIINCETKIKDVVDQKTYEEHLSSFISDTQYISTGMYNFSINVIITFSEIALSYGIPTILDKYTQKPIFEKCKAKLIFFRTENFDKSPEFAYFPKLAKIADVAFSNVLERLTHPEEKLNLFAQTRNTLTEEMNSTNPIVKWMAYRVLARTAANEGKFDEADILLSEALRDLPPQYNVNVKKVLSSLQATPYTSS